jgi:UDP-glucose 4-epimerase
MVEQILADYDRAYDLRSICLRYFNAAGADAEGEIGEAHDPETHLIPLVLDVAAGLRPAVSVFGADHPTRDGTCVRDYIHVTDLANAHFLALRHLQAGSESLNLNLGNGAGYSVREVVEAAQRVTGRPIAIAQAPARAGDPPELVGSPAKAQRLLGWTPTESSLENILRTAWAWHQRRLRPDASM